MRNGSRYEEVNITCLHVSSSSYHWLGYIVFQCVSLYNCNNVLVSCTQPSFDLTTHNAISQEVEVCSVCSNLTLNVTFINPHLLQCNKVDYDYYHYYECHNLQFTASIIDNYKNATYDWNNKLYVCPIQGCCFNVTIQSDCDSGYYNDDCLYYELDDFYLSNINPFEVSLYIQTLGLININVTVNVTKPQCKTCDKAKGRYVIPDIDEYCSSGYNYSNDYDYCYDECKRQRYINCTSDTGVPINILTCVKCKDYPLSILVFILIEILPITLMVILIIILNIQLTNGSINGVVFYSQIIAIIYSLPNCPDILYLSILPCSIFNLDFTPLLYTYSLCIAPHMSPLGAISFWYVIGFYPLLLLLLIYVWIVLYDKGFKCVVFITRPFHALLHGLFLEYDWY